MKAYKHFIDRVATEIQDVLLTSIFSQAEPISLDKEGYYIVIKMPNDSLFLRQKVKQTRSQWQKILRSTMGVEEIVFWEERVTNENDDQKVKIPHKKTPNCTRAITEDIRKVFLMFRGRFEELEKILKNDSSNKKAYLLMLAMADRYMFSVTLSTCPLCLSNYYWENIDNKELLTVFMQYTVVCLDQARLLLDGVQPCVCDDKIGAAYEA